MAAFHYEFEWDPLKARTNVSKHSVDFERAAEVFLDPLAITIPDEEHSEAEARWVTVGKDANGQYLLAVHTFEQSDHDRGRVRLISARRPTKAEIRSYEEER
jgi:uncharacterized DUF497 family protein